MIVICEECGKKYRIDPTKIKGKAASFKCRACSYLILVSKPDPPRAQAAEPPPQPAPVPKPTLESMTIGLEDDTAAASRPRSGMASSAAGGSAVRPGHRKGRFGLRTKMLGLFLFMAVSKHHVFTYPGKQPVR